MNLTDSVRVPRLPVLGWRSITARPAVAPLPAMSDGRDALLVSSGRAAIFLAMELLGIGAGDRVLVPTYHCPTMIAPIARLGAAPVFYPVDSAGSVDMNWLNSVDTTGVRAILAAHFFGLPQAMGDLRKFCDNRGIAFIEDCAHAFFGRSGTNTVGALGDFSVASLPKFFPVLEGGCLVARKPLNGPPSLAAPSALEEIRAWIDCIEVGASYARFGAPGRAFDLLASLKRRLRASTAGATAPVDEPADFGTYSQWLDERALHRRSMAASRWILEHATSPGLIERRRANYSLWTRLTKGLTQAEPLFPVLPPAAAPYVFPLRVRNPEAKYQAIRARGVPVFRWDVVWPGVPDLPGDAGRRWQTEVFQLGCHQDLDEADITRLAEIVRLEVEKE